jgi:hypothetical protein
VQIPRLAPLARDDTGASATLLSIHDPKLFSGCGARVSPPARSYPAVSIRSASSVFAPFGR